MIPHRIHAKFFFKEESAVPLPAFVPVFHRWIQERAVEGLLIDVADYKHVHQGPGIMLVGHQGDYVIDEQDGRPGLQYRGKRDWASDDLVERVQSTIRLALQARRVLEQEPTLRGRLTFYEDEISLTFHDLLQTPSTEAVFEALSPAVETALRAFYPNHWLALTQATADPRRPLTIQVQIAAPTLATTNGLHRQAVSAIW
jgi:hypothetical protein